MKRHFDNVNKNLTMLTKWVNKKEFHKSKQSIDLDLVNVDQIVVSDKFKHSDDGFKYFIGYKEGEIVKPLCIILPQMTGYIKYFENGGKNMSFVIKDDDVLDKYNEIWDMIPKENVHYACIAGITIDSVMRMEKKNYLHVYLEECKYRMKKTKVTLHNCNFVLNHWLWTSQEVGSHFADSEQVKNVVVIFLNLNGLKNLAAILLTLNELGMAAS